MKLTFVVSFVGQSGVLFLFLNAVLLLHEKKIQNSDVIFIKYI